MLERKLVVDLTKEPFRKFFDMFQRGECGNGSYVNHWPGDFNGGDDEDLGREFDALLVEQGAKPGERVLVLIWW